MFFLSPPILAVTVGQLVVVLIVVCVLSVLAGWGTLRSLRSMRNERDNLLQEKDIIFHYVQSVGDVFTESEELDTDLLLERVLYYSLRTTRAGGGAIYLLEEDRFIRAHAISGIFPPLFGIRGKVGGVDPSALKSDQLEDLIRATPIALGEGLIGQTVDFGTPLLISNAERDPRVPHFDSSLLDVRSILMVPMRFRQDVLGVIVVVNRVDGFPLSERDQSLLQALADQASVSIHYARFRSALNEKRRLDKDLHVAQHIQKGLLPQSLPELPAVEFAADNVPALEVGGDYYDVIQLDNAHVGLAIADVSGKGIGGAMMMTICRSVLRANAAREFDPAEVLREVNRTMVADMYEDMFVTMLYLVYNLETRELRYARAGHDPPLILMGNTGEVLRNQGSGLAVGMVEPELFDQTIETISVELPADSMVALYTDGITEAMNAAGEEWGVTPLIQTLQAGRALHPDQMLYNIHERVLRFVGDMPQYDDMTALIMRVGGVDEEGPGYE